MCKHKHKQRKVNKKESIFCTAVEFVKNPQHSKLSKPNNLQVILGADTTVSISKWEKKE
jgi:hypothetical protein